MARLGTPLLSNLAWSQKEQLRPLTGFAPGHPSGAGKGLVGAQPVEALEHLMLEVGAKKRSANAAK